MLRIAQEIAGEVIVMTVARIAIASLTIVAVSEISQRLPRIGGLLLSLPIVSILAFAMTWQQHRDLPAVSRLARETLVLVPLGLPFFIPLAFAEKWGLGFWNAFFIGVVGAGSCIAVWMWWARFD